MTHTYIKSDSQITSIVSCKNYQNAIYATRDGKIHVWIDMDSTKSYTIGNGMTIIDKLVCSRYGESLYNSFIAGLALQTRQVILWEEIVNIPISLIAPTLFSSGNLISHTILIQNNGETVSYQ